MPIPPPPRRSSPPATGLPPLRLLVNNASLFAHDDLRDFTAESWAAHLDVNLRAPALLSRAFAARAGRGLIVNMLDAKLAALNPDFFSYTISKIGLGGLTELARARLRARGIRVCGIAPSVTLVSGPQSRANFDKVHGLNALGRGVDVERDRRGAALHRRHAEPDRPHDPA